MGFHLLILNPKGNACLMANHMRRLRMKALSFVLIPHLEKTWTALAANQKTVR